jgi:hypothetical protein
LLILPIYYIIDTMGIEKGYDACATCPSRFLPEGEFNVTDTSTGTTTLNAGRQYRVDAESVPTCIHPLRVGMSPGDYVGRTDQEKELGIAPVPADKSNLGQWIASTLVDLEVGSYDTALDALLDRAQRAAIPDEDFVNACRVAFGMLAADIK